MGFWKNAPGRSAFSQAGTPFEQRGDMAERADTRQGGLTDEQKRQNVIDCAFGGSQERFEEFVDVIRAAIPDDTAVVLRGSAVTRERWKDGAPFDADGPGTSDLDLTLVGDEV